LVHEYLSLSKKAADGGAKLIVWPETALPVFLMDGMYAQTVDTIYSFLRKNNVYLMTGMPDVKYYFKGEKAPPEARHAKNAGYYYTMYNGILLLSPDSRKVQRYGKMKLVPFGESVPFADKLPFLSSLIKWGVGISGWNVGKDTTDFKIPAYNYSAMKWDKAADDSISINGLVCFESVFPYFVTNFVKRGARMITVVTNDSWYGKSSGPYQHEDISILRAVENRRSVIRAANGGISCIINPLGVIQKHTKLFTKTVLTGDVYLESGESFFTAHPFLVPWASVFVSLLIMLIAVYKKTKLKFMK
jgi:apolipoprotein N-acyltransferase